MTSDACIVCGRQRLSCRQVDLGGGEPVWACTGCYPAWRADRRERPAPRPAVAECSECGASTRSRSVPPVCDDCDREARETLEMPEKPTRARPGSERKIRVMERRVANGCWPTHPGDAWIDRRMEE